MISRIRGTVLPHGRIAYWVRIRIASWEKVVESRLFLGTGLGWLDKIAEGVVSITATRVPMANYYIIESINFFLTSR